MRVPVVFFVAFFAVLGGWAALETSPALKARVGGWWDGVVARLDGPSPTDGANWGDVAAKVGEFAAEERDLRRIIAGPPGGEAVAQPAPVAQ